MITNLVGNRIREIRARRKITQQQLADSANIPRATLATIEKDESNPSLAAVYKIAVALNCSIDDLLEKQHDRVEVIRHENMGRVESGDGNYRATTVSPLGNPAYGQQAFTLAPASTYVGKPHPPGSEEYLYILDGELTLEVAGERIPLAQGDSAHFRGNINHSYHNTGHAAAKGIVTIIEFPAAN
ncbi:XRE family transcriptional regulator [Sedimenticola hydrogenitrophicus]|uniref:XRE family transcriptional regulator n=1 Tax=Sedimenticola hydrogenitrophicus TaxID=2967975 RepID=UPI0023AFDAED|nr:XRE family transcriptional regulator [Sedimenticola hydrogenitrophicus]